LLPWLLALALAIAFPLASSPRAWGADGLVTVQELVERAEEYDGQEVVIEGEAVGDVMIRGEEAWITVNDDPYSRRSLEEGGEFAGLSNCGIGVVLPRKEAEKVKVLGSYKHHGDRVRVRGIFHRADPSHGGDTVIEGRFLEVVEPGYPIKHPFSYGKLAVGLSLALVALFLGSRLRKKKEASVF
ncbi:MAG: hypothetical protein QME89_12595, partial [Actinomycetota bacterium]|nr:hypothetical protein [Actinomycetota bacterium]